MCVYVVVAAQKRSVAIADRVVVKVAAAASMLQLLVFRDSQLL